MTIDTTTDIPYIAHQFVREHVTLRHAKIPPLPDATTHLRSADRSPLTMKGYIRFNPRLGDKRLPVEVRVLPNLCPDNTRLDKSTIMHLEPKWIEMLSFSNSDVIIPAVHNNDNSNPAHCSVVTMRTRKYGKSVYFARKCIIRDGHEVAVQVVRATAPIQDKQLVIDQRIVTDKDDLSPEEEGIWHKTIVARTVCKLECQGPLGYCPNNKSVRE